MLTDLEKQVIRELQSDLEVSPAPFRRLAASLGLEEAVVLETIRSLQERGYIRRFGATIRHRISGFSANAMAAWAVPAEQMEHVGRRFAARREVTHCYERQTTATWPYNLFTMIHGRTQAECEAIARDMAMEVGIDTYEMLFSDAELKKTTMRYFFDVDFNDAG